jgi:hypothetical protein
MPRQEHRGKGSFDPLAGCGGSVSKDSDANGGTGHDEARADNDAGEMECGPGRSGTLRVSSVLGDDAESLWRSLACDTDCPTDWRSMTERSLNEMGPVDFLIVEFPAGQQNFTGEGAAELFRLHDAGIIRVMDLLILTKDEDGSVDAVELEDMADAGELAQLEAELAETLAADDVVNLAAAMSPGSVAGVVVYENLWAAPFASALRRAGGQLVADGRIPTQAIIAAIEADEAAEAEGA